MGDLTDDEAQAMLDDMDPVKRLRHLLGEQEALALRYLARAEAAEAEVERLRKALLCIAATHAESAVGFVAELALMTDEQRAADHA